MQTEAELLEPKLEVIIVPNDWIIDIFPKIVPILEKNREHWEDYYRLEDLQKYLINGNLQLWIGIDKENAPDQIKLIMITQLTSYPRSIWLRYSFIGGEYMRYALRYRRKVIRWARARGAVGEEFVGSRGWVPMMGTRPDNIQIFATRKFGEGE